MGHVEQKLVRKPEWKRSLEYQKEDKRIILKWISNKQNMRM
jgi:hypothetical protein